jgi:hypothetical protein
MANAEVGDHELSEEDAGCGDYQDQQRLHATEESPVSARMV